MGRSKQRRTPGLIRIGETWHIDKRIGGRRLCESCRTNNREEAELFLARRIEEIRQGQLFGVRPARTFYEAATKYLEEQTKRSLDRDAQDLKQLVEFIGDLPLSHVHMGTLHPYIAAKRQSGVKSSTVNRALAVVRRILNLAARLWRDENGLTWMETAPLLQMQDWGDVRPPRPIDWVEQRALLQALPAHLQRMALFALNTGARQEEICGLRWGWECVVPEIGTSVFVLPGQCVKNGEARVIVLNRVARSVVEALRGMDSEFVFTYRGRRIGRIYNTAWKRARVQANLPGLRVHDLRHTYGRRLRAAGVPHETRKVLLGHKNGDMTTHYSAPELAELIAASERVCEGESRKTPELTVLRLHQRAASG